MSTICNGNNRRLNMTVVTLGDSDVSDNWRDGSDLHGGGGGSDDRC